MALSGNELVRVTGIINGGPAATTFNTTTQNLANLRTGAASTLTGLEPISVRGASGGGIPSAVPFITTTGAIGALGSLAPSTLTGSEIVLVGPPETGSAPAAVYEQTTALNIANA